MRLVRTVARPMLAGLFIASGMDVLANPEPRAKLAKPVVDKVAAFVPLAPSDPKAAVALNAAVHVGAGSMLAAGILPRLAAVALATSLVPTTLAAHRFWELEDPALRSRQRVEFLKNCAILGGLLVVALD
ncbi:MAG: DoxX family protein [Chloroflexota bacterium]|nr:MAG: DoxX family protein [Chloroflexota bacterium]TMD87283.1 MAG: DoxX family protein [Chloroflexota bacterium]